MGARKAYVGLLLYSSSVQFNRGSKWRLVLKTACPAAYRPRQKLMVFTLWEDRVDLTDDLDVLQREKSLASGGNTSSRPSNNPASDFLHAVNGSYEKGLPLKSAVCTFLPRHHPSRVKP